MVGWDGYLYPYAFNIADFEPIVKRTHAPPPVHQTFEGPNFVICSFCPRPLDFDPEAVPIPYNHHNVDSDEMMYYVAGDYSARKGSGVGLGSITLHPSGFTHGPQPGAVEAVIRGLAEGKTTTDETAVMIDTFRPLLLAAGGPPGRGPGVRLELGPGRPRLNPSSGRSGFLPDVFVRSGRLRDVSRAAPGVLGSLGDACRTSSGHCGRLPDVLSRPPTRRTSSSRAGRSPRSRPPWPAPRSTRRRPEGRPGRQSTAR